MGKLLACALIIASTIFLTEPYTAEPADAKPWKVAGSGGGFAPVWFWERIQTTKVADKLVVVAASKTTWAWSTEPLDGTATNTHAGACGWSHNSGTTHTGKSQAYFVVYYPPFCNKAISIHQWYDARGWHDDTQVDNVNW